MEIVEIKSKWYERRSKAANSTWTGRLTKSRPVVDRDFETVILYTKAFKLNLTREEFIEVSKGASRIKYKLLITMLQTFNEDALNNPQNYILKVGTNCLNACSTYLDCYHLHVDCLDENDILFFNKNDGNEILELNKKERERKIKAQNRIDTINIINNFVLPYLTPVLEEYGLETKIYSSDDKKSSTAMIRFKSTEAIHKFVTEAIKEKLTNECKQLGFELSDLLIKEKGITKYTDLFDLYSSKITLNDEN